MTTSPGRRKVVAMIRPIRHPQSSRSAGLGRKKPMSEYDIHALTPADFDGIMELEEVLFHSKGDKTLGAFYVRLCCDFYGDTSFIACADGKPIGYLLSFVRDREAYCSTL